MASGTGRRCVILGGADCVWSDLDNAQALFTPDAVIACNHAARDYYGFVDHSVTMHPDIRDRLWIPARRAAGLPDAGQLWHPRHRGAWPGSTPIESKGGSSGMLCIRVALELGFDKIVLCGVPMAKLNRHYDDHRPWIEARQYHNVWLREAPALQGRVKSMSGWTREVFGAPDEGWINA